MEIKFALIVFCIILVIYSVSKITFQNHKKIYLEYLCRIIYILLSIIVFKGSQTWTDMIYNWKFYSVLLISMSLIQFFIPYSETLHLKNKNIIVDAIIQVLQNNNCVYKHEDDLGIVVFSLNGFNKITLRPITKLFKDEIKEYHIRYFFINKKDLISIQKKIHQNLNL